MTIPSRDKRLLPDSADRVEAHRAVDQAAGSAVAGAGVEAGAGAAHGAAPQGVTALWGAQRVLRQRINRMHYSFYDTFGDSAFNARPYSLYEANPPKISSWTESAGFNIGGPLKIPHVYDGTDKTFFYINFGGTWSRSPVDQFATVPTLAERNGDFSADNILLYNPLSNLTGPRSLMTNAGCFQATPSSPLPPAGTCIPTNLISHAGDQSAHLHSHAQYSGDERRRAEFQLSPADESPRPEQPPERQRHAPALLEAEPGGELQPQRCHLALAEQLSGNRGKHIHARTERDDRADAELDQDVHAHVAIIFFAQPVPRTERVFGFGGHQLAARPDGNFAESARLRSSLHQFHQFHGAERSDFLPGPQPDVSLRRQSPLDEDQAHHHRRRRSPEVGHQPRRRSRAQRLFCIYRIDDQPADCHGRSSQFSRQLPVGCSLRAVHRKRFRGFSSRLPGEYQNSIWRYVHVLPQLGLHRLRHRRLAHVPEIYADVRRAL